ncbi:hypothetical protein EXU48_16410 [Occultella glacieicola]|uniref:Uncharacterized protein n=1 Tax=Occultella glacieicola TaxID=2518684 RepID=A0ABY2E174_9MICO|nr:hypothetical protein [Occultella glacieicola]TDE91706.1 hypothetical protein EXU48_16410 [Occultella glacieicola]
MATITPAPTTARAALPARPRPTAPTQPRPTGPAVPAVPTGRAADDRGTHAPPSTRFAAVDARPRPVRDGLLPATLSLLAVLGILTGLAAAAGWVVRLLADYMLG